MVSDQQRSRQPQSHGHRHIMPNSPLVSTSFIASWRGQVLICTVCLAFGAVYFFVRRAVTPIIQRRREAISEARQAELMLLEAEIKKRESSEPLTSAEKSGSKGAKGKDKRIDGQKRKASSTLKVNVTKSGSENRQQTLGGTSTAGSGQSQAGPSSRESSPAARHLTLPTSTSKSTPKRPIESNKQPIALVSRDRSISISNSSYSPSPSPSPTPLIRVRQPTAEEAVRLPALPLITSTSISKAAPADIGQYVTSDRQRENDAKPSRNESEFTCDSVTSQRNNTSQKINNGNTDPNLIPLPPSPTIEPGPSPCFQDHDYDPGNESDSTSIHSISSPSNMISGSTTNASTKSHFRLPAMSPDGGFSIMPDARYLPPSITSSTTYKKKKKKDRSPDLFDNNHSFNRSHSPQSNQTRLSSSTNTTTITNNQSSDNLSRYSQPTSVDTESNNPNSPSTKHSKPPLDTPLILRPSGRGHSRKPSLKSIRPPPNPTPEQLEEYCIERDQVVENLRAELGSAKAQEAKAKEDASGTRLELERIRDDLEHLTKQSAAAKAEHTRVVTQVSIPFQVCGTFRQPHVKILHPPITSSTPSHSTHHVSLSPIITSILYLTTHHCPTTITKPPMTPPQSVSSPR